MSAPGSSGTPREGGRTEELRGYLQAAGDLSAIARARIVDAGLDALRTEVERAGTALGLAGVEEVTRLRRTVDRLERRVQALEAAAGGAPRAATRLGRPPRRPAGTEQPVQAEPVQPVQPEAVGQPAPVQPEAVQPEAVQPEAVQPEAVQPEAVQPAPVRRAPVRRPRPAPADPAAPGSAEPPVGGPA
jgi:hypothetical protein